MFTSPTPPWQALVAQPGQAPAVAVPVQESIWHMFGPESDAITLLSRVQALSKDAKIVDNSKALVSDGNLQLEPEIPNPTNIGVWGIMGTLVQPDGTVLQVNESANGLFDRQSQPSSTDKSVNAHNPAGGPNLCWRNVDGADAELYWSVDIPNPVL